jgi:outer membrane receptor protein involved in Fe transport
MKSYTVFPLGLLSAVLLATAAVGQSGAPETIVVRASRLQDAPVSRVVSAAVLGQDRLQALPGAALDDVLRGEAGFQLFRRTPSPTANPTVQGPTLRSLGGNAAGRALVTLDGVPQDDPFGGWVAWGTLDPNQLARIVVVRGGGAGAFGAGALAGVIALDSLALSERPRVRADVAIGLRGALDAATAARVDLGNGALGVRARWTETDGHFPIERARRGPVDRRLSARTRVAEAQGQWPVGDGAILSTGLRAFDDDRINGLALTPNAADGFDGNLRLVRDGAADGWSYEALVYGKKRRFESGFAAVNATRTSATPSLDQFDVPAHGFGGKLEVRPPLPVGLTAQLGLDARAARGETRERFRFLGDRFTRLREAGGAQRTFGLFAEGSVQWRERWTAVAGLRLDDWRQYDGARSERDRESGLALLDTRFAPRKGRVFTGRAGLAYEAAPGWTARAFAYRGFRLPTLNELYRPFRVGNDVTEANALLRPERLTGFDIGLARQNAEGVSLDVTMFVNRIEDAVANVTIGRGPGVFPVVGFLPAGGVLRQRDNLGSVRAIGVEVRGAWPLSSVLSIDFSYAYTATRIREAPVAALVGKRLAQSPRHSASAGLDMSPTSNFRLFVRGRALAAQFDDDENERRLRPAFVVDAGARWEPAAHWAVSLTAENLFDARVETARSGDGLLAFGPPLHLRLGLAYEF